MVCSICESEKTKILYVEKTTDYGDLTNLECLDCNTIFCRDMDDIISPDYVDITINEDHIWLQSDHKHRAFKQFSKKLAEHEVIPYTYIDYGCGTGGFLRYLSRNHEGQNFYGYDFSEKEIECARGISNQETYNVAKSLSECLSDVDFDNKICILSMWDVLEHIRRPKEFGKSMKNYSFVYISVPSSEFQKLKYKLSKLLGRKPYFMSHEHVTYFSQKGLKLFIQSCGFEIVECFSIEIYDRKKMTVKNLLRKLSYKLLCLLGYPPQIGILAKRA